MSARGCGCENFLYCGEGEIPAGFLEEVTFVQGFEAQAGSHWLANKSRSNQKKAGREDQQYLNPAAPGWGGGGVLGIVG